MQISALIPKNILWLVYRYWTDRNITDRNENSFREQVLKENHSWEVSNTKKEAEDKIQKDVYSIKHFECEFLFNVVLFNILSFFAVILPTSFIALRSFLKEEHYITRMSLQVPSAFKFWCILFKKRVNIVAKAVSIYVFNMLNSINNISLIACFVLNPELFMAIYELFFEYIILSVFRYYCAF